MGNKQSYTEEESNVTMKMLSNMSQSFSIKPPQDNLQQLLNEQKISNDLLREILKELQKRN